MPSIELSDEVLAALGALAEPFVDTTPEAVIRKLLAGATTASAQQLQSPQSYSAASAPNLAFTKVTAVMLGNETLPPEETYWNHAIRALLVRAGRQLRLAEEIRDHIGINAVVGEKTNNGYRFVPEAGVSFQQQDANGAWKAIKSLARYLGIEVVVTFEWLENPKAANPGAAARLVA